VRLATSYYSPSASEHDAITGRHRSHDLTLANIMRALQRKVPIRAGVIGVEGGQDVDGAVAELTALGIADVGVDHIRQVGRGARDAQPGFSQLCGHCADGKLAVMASGDVYPCVFSRWLPVGDARRTSLIEIHQIADGARTDLRAAFAGRMPAMAPAPCVPSNQPPCPPMIQCGPAAQPCGPDRDGRDHR
jgi:hypothetical protein